MKMNTKFAKKYGVKILPFKKLPAPARYAIIHYMAIDGEAWDVSDQLAESFAKGHKMIAKSKGSYDKVRKLHKEAVIKSLKFYTEKYGDRKFGYGLIPTKAFVKEIWDRDDGVKDWKMDGMTFKEYQEWYFKEGASMPNHPKTNRWSCILSSFDFEVLEDGWHRFHSYVMRGDKTIPCVHYA